MPLFEITKTLYTTLTINCNSIEEAKEWANMIVATVEVDDSDEISPNLESFEAESIPNEIKIKEIQPET